MRVPDISIKPLEKGSKSLPLKAAKMVRAWASASAPAFLKFQSLSTWRPRIVSKSKLTLPKCYPIHLDFQAQPLWETRFLGSSTGSIPHAIGERAWTSLPEITLHRGYY